MENRLKRFWFSAAAFLTMAILLSAIGCGEEGEADEPRLRVVTTLPVLEDMVREIGGDRVDVRSLFPFGADPHTYEPVPGDIQRVAEADVIFANGLDLEPAALRVIEPNVPASAIFVELAEEALEAGATVIEFDEDHAHEDEHTDEHAEDHAHEDEDEHADEHAGEADDHQDHDHGPIDPHLWLDVDNVREYARIIRDALTEADPEGADTYEENYQGYLARLDEVEQYVRGKIEEIPPERRKLVTTHDSFGYLARAMGLEVVAFVAESPGQEPSARDVARLGEKIRDTGVPAVFEEPQLGAEATVLRRAADDAGVQVCTLYSDSLDERVPTYIDLMRFNADELARCLG